MPSSLTNVVLSCWALFLGIGVLMLGDGLQGTLLAVRADQAGFRTTVTGIVMSSFYVGFLAGSVVTPKIVGRVGHVRVFAALAALASAAILVHAVFVTPAVWILLRLISGFCFAGLYVVAETWLNDRATNQTRGQVLAVYMVVTYMGVAIGQLLLNLADPGGYPLFVLTSVLISIAVVPLLLSAGPAPHFEQSSHVSLSELYKISPLGVVGIFFEGLVIAAFFALGPVYGQRIGLSLTEISYFMAAAVTGVVILQWPIGALSDRFDRRKVLTIVSALTAMAAFVCIYAAEVSTLALLIMVGLFGGLAMPVYSLCIAHTNDHLQPEQMIAAGGGLILASGIGAVLGPVLTAAVMDYSTPASFFWCLGGFYVLIAAFAVYRMIRRAPTPLERQGPPTPGALRPSISVVESIQQYAKEESK